MSWTRLVLARLGPDRDALTTWYPTVNVLFPPNAETRRAFSSCGLSGACGSTGCALNGHVEKAPFVALVDDDQQSAQLLTRMLLAHGSPAIRWYGDAAAGHDMLASAVADTASDWPGLVIVDLKSHSGANVEFLRSIQSVIRNTGLPVVAMTQCAERVSRDTLLEAGATTVFFRHAELGAYRREAASLVSFWARSQRLEAVGM